MRNCRCASWCTLRGTHRCVETLHNRFGPPITPPAKPIFACMRDRHRPAGMILQPSRQDSTPHPARRDYGLQASKRATATRTSSDNLGVNATITMQRRRCYVRSETPCKPCFWCYPFGIPRYMLFWTCISGPSRPQKCLHDKASNVWHL